jgi:2-succinyl-5-enolpyruvyl-6-hydroxy-3-cyclohexene-1-carboxylate synthase
MALGRTVLITGDLAMLHDTNGWLCASPKQPPLVVLLIDNGGGGIFTQLDLETESNKTFEKLFSMPQSIDFLALAQTYGIAYRQVSCLEDLQASLDWSFSKPCPTLLRFCTNACSDASKRKNIRMGLTNQLQDFQHNKH